MEMEADDLAIQSRTEAATKEPWVGEGDCVVASKGLPRSRPNGEVIGRFLPSISNLLSHEQNVANASLAANAPTDLKALLRDKKKLIKRNEELVEVLNTLTYQFLNDAEGEVFVGPGNSTQIVRELLWDKDGKPKFNS